MGDDETCTFYTGITSSHKEEVWKLTSQESYKSERLAEYQQLLKDRGITNKDHLRLLAAQLYQEDGTITAERIGDHGCSLGLMQYNACAHNHMSAKTFLARNPKWKDYKFQLAYMADWVAARYDKFDGNIKQVIVDHNRPASAAINQDTPAGYFATIKKKATLFSSN